MIDVHAHLEGERFEKDLEKVVGGIRVDISAPPRATRRRILFPLALSVTLEDPVLFGHRHANCSNLQQTRDYDAWTRLKQFNCT